MDRNLLARRGTRSALVATAFLIAGGPVVAQAVQEVIVEAPRTVSTHADQTSPPGGAQVEVTTIKMHVSYADLDLGKSSDVVVLQARIKAAANDECKQLDKLYPLTPDEHCVEEAVVTATAQVEAALAAVGR